MNLPNHEGREDELGSESTVAKLWLPVLCECIVSWVLLENTADKSRPTWCGPTKFVIYSREEIILVMLGVVGPLPVDSVGVCS